MKKQSKCKVCGKKFSFDDSVQKGLYCCVKCRYADHSNIIKDSYTPELKKLRSEHAKEQMKDKKQIEIRQQKCGYKMTDEQREKLSDSKIKNSFTRAKKLIIKERGEFCERCGKDISDWQLTVHHKNGRKWDNDLDNLQILCRSCHSKLHNQIGKLSSHFAGLATVENYIALMLQHLGVDLDDPDFKETPLRVARMYNEQFEGLKPEAKDEIKNIFGTRFPCENDNMVVIDDIRVYSLCPHHLVTIIYDIAIGYVPNKFVLGLSKFARISELLAHKPVIQETFTAELGKAIEDELKPLGVAVRIKGTHFCMVSRGAKQQNSKTMTAYMSGVFRDNKDNSRSEFYKLIEK